MLTNNGAFCRFGRITMSKGIRSRKPRESWHRMVRNRISQGDDDGMGDVLELRGLI